MFERLTYDSREIYYQSIFHNCRRFRYFFILLSHGVLAFFTYYVFHKEYSNAVQLYDKFVIMFAFMIALLAIISKFMKSLLDTQRIIQGSWPEKIHLYDLLMALMLDDLSPVLESSIAGSYNAVMNI